MPRSLVHRASVAEVFLTDGCRTEDGRVLIAAQWPRNHALYRPDSGGNSDPVLLIETTRQAAIYTAHRFFAVPESHRFIFCSLDCHIEDPALFQVGEAPLEVVLDGEFVLEAPRSDHRVGARFDAHVEIGGRRCARVSVRLLAVGDKLYSVLRRRGATPATAGSPGPFPDAPTGSSDDVPVLSAAAVGQSSLENVLLYEDGSASGCYPVRLDRDHPGYFEHSSDHVPGMALVEAFRQAGHHLLGREEPAAGAPYQLPPLMTLSCEVSFDAFGELDRPLAIEAVDCSPDVPPTAGRRRIRMAAVQDGRTLASATVVYRPRPGAERRPDDMLRREWRYPGECAGDDRRGMHGVPASTRVP